MYPLARRILFHLDAERAHHLATMAGRVGQVVARSTLERQFSFESERLACDVMGLHFDNVIGLAAGMDKNAVLVPFWRLAGMGFTEIGSVSARKCRGNRRPRAFRLPLDEALVNRMGLNNQGADRIARRVARFDRSRPLAINLVKTHDASIAGQAAVDDFVASFKRLAPLASFIVLNLSCPNTAEGKTFEDPNTLDDLLIAIMAERAKVAPGVPVLLKLSPPVSERIVFDSAVDEIVAVGASHGVAGYVATNTASDRDGLVTPEDQVERFGMGGLSGRPLEGRATRLVRYLFRKTEGRVPIIGVGGIFSADDAYRKIRAGASLVELYTGLVFEGPGLVRRLKEDLLVLLDRDGIDRIEDAVGLDA